MYQDSSSNPVNAMQLVDTALSAFHAVFAAPHCDHAVVDVETYNDLVREYNDLVDRLVERDNDAQRCIAQLQSELRLARLLQARSSLELAQLRAKLAKLANAGR